MLGLTRTDALQDVEFVLAKLQQLKQEIEFTVDDEQAVKVARDFFRTALLCALDTEVLNNTNFAQVRGVLKSNPRSSKVRMDEFVQKIVSFTIISVDGNSEVRVRALTPAAVRVAENLKKGDWVQTLGFLATLGRTTFLAAYGIRPLKNVSFVDRRKLN